MTHTIKDGWAHINGGYVSGLDCGMSLRCHWELSQKNPDVIIEHYPGDGQYGFDLGTRERRVNLKNVYFESQSDAEDCLACFDSLNNNISGFTLELQVKSDNSRFKLVGGTGTVMRVLCTDYSKVEKESFGDSQIYKISMIKLEQCR